MKAYRLVFVLLLVALLVTPLFCVNTSLFSTAKQGHSRGFNPQLIANSKDRHLNVDITKIYYLPEEWVTWYWLYGIGCTSMIEEEWGNGDWIMDYETEVVRSDGKPVMATSTDYTETPAVMGRYEYTYTANSQNQPATITSSYFSNNQWNYDKRQTYSYNEFGGITQVSVEEYYNGGGWVPIELATCVSNLDRLIEVTVQEYDFDLLMWVNEMHMTLTWNGTLVNEVIEQNWIGNSWQNSSRIQYAHTVQNNVLQVTLEDWSNNPGFWMESERHTYTFVDGLWTEEIIEDHSSTLGWVQEWKGIMSYNNEGYPIYQLGYYWETNIWDLCERMSFYYEGMATQGEIAPNLQLVVSNYPNPFIGATTISYKLPQPAQTELSIYNLRGQLVRKLVNEPLTSGQHTVTWDGKDDNGKALASGMYLCRISSAGKQETHKMLLMK
jgi:hypothetical protein